MERLKELEGQMIQLMMYYHHELNQNGMKDSKQQLATMIPRWIQLSEAQLHFIEKEVELPYYKDMINEMMIVLKTLSVTDKESEQSVKLILKCLSQLQLLFKEGE